jgi:glycosyltransferase involved in cell wall biosynthesis
LKILTINAYDIDGGSAIAAYRLCKGLERYYDDLEIHFMVGKKKSFDPKIYCTREKRIEDYIEKVIDNITNRFGFQYFCFPFSTKAILKHVYKLNPDIIYLRNIHGGYFKTSLIYKLNKFAPIVWTLSDMWSFTGHCAHSFGNMDWKQMKSGCPDLDIFPSIGLDTGKWLLKRKKRIYQKSNLTIVTPSRWLEKMARQSPVFKGKKIVQIHNGFDLDIFYPKDKVACRETLNIPKKAKVLMFSAYNVKKRNPWKGGNDLINILCNINKLVKEKIHLIVMGNGNIEELQKNRKFVVHQFGYVKNDIFLAACYSASDALLYPTRADNLPNVLIESISCGTPAITFDVGGCAEIISDGIDGFVINEFNVEKFSLKTIEILNDSEKQRAFSMNARKSAEKRFTLKKMCMNYRKVFENANRV